MPEMHFLQDLLILFAMGVVAVVAFHRFNLPPVLGFLVTGVICGPYGFRLVDAGQGIETMSEIGLVLLLFTIGIEFSVKTFVRLRKFLLIAGSLQVGLTIAAAAALVHSIGVAWTTAIFIGMLLSMSSTAIVIRILEYRGDMDSAHGRSALSILIFQDLCIVPMVLATPFLAGQGTSLAEMGMIIGKALLFLVLAATVARYLVPWLLSQVARTKKREAFVLAIILLCLGTATATSHFGLSMALGAFIAGLIVSESKYSHQAMGEVVPFREVFNCLVFVSIGMMFDVTILVANPLPVVLTLLIVVGLKAFVTTGITRLFGHSLKVALLTGFALAQVSEFSFVLSKLGASTGIIDPLTNQLFLAVAILSMFMTPAALWFGTRLGNKLEPMLPRVIAGTTIDPCGTDADKMSDHAIIVGFSLAGRNLASVCADAGIKYVIIDQDPQVVRSERARGTPIMYGDASRLEVLKHAGMEHARVLVLTVSDQDMVLRATELARRTNAELAIVARARYLEDAPALTKVGATHVVAEELVGSLEILNLVLAKYEMPDTAVGNYVAGLKQLHERNAGQKPAPGTSDNCLPCVSACLQIEIRRIPLASPLVGKTLAQAGFAGGKGLTVIAVQRPNGTVLPNPPTHQVLSANDSLVLLGQPGSSEPGTTE